MSPLIRQNDELKFRYPLRLPATNCVTYRRAPSISRSASDSATERTAGGKALSCASCGGWRLGTGDAHVVHAGSFSHPPPPCSPLPLGRVVVKYSQMRWISACHAVRSTVLC